MKDMFKSAVEAMRRTLERRELVNEYARNLVRNKEILARLGVLNSTAEIEAMAERLLDDWPAARALVPQAEVVRRYSPDTEKPATAGGVDVAYIVRKFGGENPSEIRLADNVIYGQADFGGVPQAFKIVGAQVGKP